VIIANFIFLPSKKIFLFNNIYDSIEYKTIYFLNSKFKNTIFLIKFNYFDFSLNSFENIEDIYINMIFFNIYLKFV